MGGRSATTACGQLPGGAGRHHGPRHAAARRPRAPSPTQTSRSSADRPSSCPPGRRRLLHSAAQEPAPDGSPTPLAGRVARRHSREPPGRPLLLRRPGTGSRHNPVGRPVDSSCGPARVVIFRALGHGGTSPTAGASWPAAQPDPAKDVWLLCGPARVLMPGAARDCEASRDTSPAELIRSGHQAGSLPARPSHQGGHHAPEPSGTR